MVFISRKTRIGRQVPSLCVALLATLFAAATASAATITIINTDQSGEGFNDITLVEPFGGNSGESLGEQRMIAVRHAADIWAAALDSDVEIEVSMSFDPLPCSSDGAVLGAAGPNCVHSNFPGALRDDTLYPSALANKLFGADLCPANSSCKCPSADIVAFFNSAIGSTCSFGGGYYLGLDGDARTNEVDLVTVALHELAHGLGFLTFVNVENGKRLSGLDDHFMINLLDASRGLTWEEMVFNGERQGSAVDNFDLHWTGPNVTASTDILRLGVDEGTGRAFMYAPETVRVGSSVSHFDIKMAPNQLMEASYIEPIHSLSLSARLMEDIGWGEVTDDGTGGDPNAAATRCGDVNNDTLLTAADALQVLRRAVTGEDLPEDVYCPQFICDVDNNGTVFADDALDVLRAAVLLPVDLNCGPPTSMKIRMTSSQRFGSLQVEVETSRSQGSLVGTGGGVQCVRSRVIDRQGIDPVDAAVFNRIEEDKLLSAYISEIGAQGPRSLAVCQYDFQGPVNLNDFVVTVSEARDISGQNLNNVEVIAYPN